MKKFIFLISGILCMAYLCLGANLIDLGSLTSNPEKFVGKSISIEGTLFRKCPKSKDRFFIANGNNRFGLLVPEGLNIDPNNLLKKDIIVTGKVRKINTQTNPERCSKCDGNHCGQYAIKTKGKNSYDLYYLEIESISEKK
ncbi:MAG: hypothetical protein AB7S48_14045 [Bacteroidales bacterium]